ncbi:Thiosulfate sulfurtransferase GlpE [Microbacterium lemovicicum]|uniref:Thiosulfate sulfurtransferase GlpE n=1 Tax=Microbacterium lemovicicum TaxID=1072463 RepID=A0A3S9W926_9MICO|nr:rhodanese-like domain-containing protein [Microbacterium lemovicicum]AZS36591.1 Thiosulfate sulfurtransferase GlpE [Microbacterium lemovicicum]
MTTDLPTSTSAPTATADAAAAYFAAKLACETDPSDVYEAQKAGERFLLVDVRGAEAWAQGRIPGAVHIPYGTIAERAAHDIPLDMPVVVYCWSPGCNAGAKGALAFTQAGYSVREMIGGFEYWAREGYPTEDDDGTLPRMRDRLVALVR